MKTAMLFNMKKREPLAKTHSVVSFSTKVEDMRVAPHMDLGGGLLGQQCRKAIILALHVGGPIGGTSKYTASHPGS